MRLLDDDALRHVLQLVRRDRLGNETVPSLIFESRVWRRLCKRFLRLSLDWPSAYDARLSYSKGLPRTFMGGVLCSPMVDQAHTKPLKLFLLRDPQTGRVWAVCSSATHPISPTDVLSIDVVLTLKHLVQLISGQNADFETRLDHFDKMISGAHIKRMVNSIDEQSVDGLAPPATLSSHARNVSCVLKWNFRILVGSNHVRLKPKLFLRIPLQGLYDHTVNFTAQLGELLNDFKVAPKLPPISIRLGFYDHPKVAECGDMQIGIHTHHLPREMMPRVKSNDPELHMRILGRAALDRAQRIEAEQTALTVYGHGGGVGPSGAPARRPRSAATEARQSIQAAIQTDNDTLSTGRLRLSKQAQDEESREAEALGFVDDQYAGFGEAEDEPLLYDSDGAYDDDAPSRTKRAMAKERKAEVLAESVLRARAWLVPSDDEFDI